MGDDINEENASTSKNEEDEVKGADKRDDDGGDSRMESASFQSSSVSTDSRIEKVMFGNKIAKLASVVMKELKPLRKNKKSNKKEIPPSRIQKRQLPRLPRKQLMKRKTLRNSVAKRKHTYSISTILTNSSSQSVSPSSDRCQRCGHRCCRRNRKSKKEIKKRKDNRNLKTALKKTAQTKGRQNVCKKMKPNITVKSECVQAGSECLMLSSLCESRKNVPKANKSVKCCEVTPEMIYESMQRLTMWQHDVATVTILKYIKRHYPVCQDIPILFEELMLKLQVAAIVGFVIAAPNFRWRLACPLLSRDLASNHVTLFWLTYADTMKPVTRKDPFSSPPKETEEQNTNTKSEHGVIHFNYDVV